MVCIMCRSRADICADIVYLLCMHVICMYMQNIGKCVRYISVCYCVSPKYGYKPNAMHAFKYIVCYVHTTTSYLVGSYYLSIMWRASTSVAFVCRSSRHKCALIMRVHGLPDTVSSQQIAYRIYIYEGQMRRPEIVRACMRKCVYL